MEIEGIISGIKEETKKFMREEIHGVSIILKTPEGEKEVYFPRIISLTDEQSLMNQKVQYGYDTSPAGDLLDPLYVAEYTLRILSGPLRDMISKREIFI